MAGYGNGDLGSRLWGNPSWIEIGEDNDTSCLVEQVEFNHPAINLIVGKKGHYRVTDAQQSLGAPGIGLGSPCGRRLEEITNNRCFVAKKRMSTPSDFPRGAAD